MSHLGPKRKYISVIYDDSSQNNLRRWVQEMGFTLSSSWSGNPIRPESFVFHTTVFHSTSQHMDVLNRTSMTPSVEMKPKRFKWLGKKLDVPVLILDKTPLMKLRTGFVKMFDMKDDWPTFVPHISLSYDKGLDKKSNFES